MPDSRSLGVALVLGRAHASLMAWLVTRLRAQGHEAISVPALDFMGQLDCGRNYASDVARTLGVSRQMVAKTVAELARRGWLTQKPDPDKRNRKIIVFTAEGEQVMADTRTLLKELDGLLDTRLSGGWAERLSQELEALRRAVDDRV